MNKKENSGNQVDNCHNQNCIEKGEHNTCKYDQSGRETPGDIIRSFSTTMQEHNLSSISYKGKDAQGNDVEIKMETQLPVTPVFATAPVSYQMPQVAQPHAAPVSSAAAIPASVAPASTPPAPAADSSNTATIKSPMLGTLYVAPKPEAAPFIKVGDRITKGQDIFIIECMKVLSTVKSTQAGTVKEILVQNGKPVEYDQQLVIVTLD